MDKVKSNFVFHSVSLLMIAINFFAFFAIGFLQQLPMPEADVLICNQGCRVGGKMSDLSKFLTLAFPKSPTPTFLKFSDSDSLT